MKFLVRNVCPGCAGTNSKSLLVRSYSDSSISEFLASYYGGRVPQREIADAKYEIRECMSCGLLWQVQILDPSGMKLLYEQWISPEESRRKREAGADLRKQGYRAEVKAIPRILKSKSKIRVLDYGMGWGEWAREAASQGLEVTGIDLSSSRVESVSADGIRVAGLTQEIQSASLDFINAEQVMEHVANPREVVAEFRRMLVSGGVLRMSVPDGKSARSELRKPGWSARKDCLMPMEHINCFTRGALQNLGRNQGFEPIMAPWLRGRESWVGEARALMGFLYRARRGSTVYFRKKR